MQHPSCKASSLSLSSWTLAGPSFLLALLSCSQNCQPIVFRAHSEIHLTPKFNITFSHELAMVQSWDKLALSNTWLWTQGQSSHRQEVVQLAQIVHHIASRHPHTSRLSCLYQHNWLFSLYSSSDFWRWNQTVASASSLIQSVEPVPRH